MNTRNLIITALLLMIAAATSASAPERCTEVAVHGAQRGTDRFSARNETDLTIEVTFDRSFSGDHLVELVFTTPNGHLYMRRVVPVTDNPRAAAVRTVAGYPRPLPVERLQPRDDGLASLKVAFPFGGTTITKSALYGAWTIDVIVDGARAPCATLDVELAP